MLPFPSVLLSAVVCQFEYVSYLILASPTHLSSFISIHLSLSCYFSFSLYLDKMHNAEYRRPCEQKVFHLHWKHDIDFFVVDFLQLIWKNINCTTPGLFFCSSLSTVLLMVWQKFYYVSCFSRILVKKIGQIHFQMPFPHRSHCLLLIKSGNEKM